MKILRIDTRSNVTILSLSAGREVSELCRETPGSYVEHLVPMVNELLGAKGLGIKDIDKVIVERGPGSWNGTRVGVVTAKVLAWSLGIPVEGVPEWDGEEINMVPEYPGKHEETLKKNYETVQ